MTILIVVGGVLGLLALAAAAWIYVVNTVETPDYEVALSDGSIELRDYPPLVVAQVKRAGGRGDAVNQGFGPLARYIFAKDRSGESISMTAPVTQERIAMTAPVTQTETDEGQWIVRFIMPAEYDLETLPQPASDDVRLDRIPARRMAAIRFSGVATDALIEDNETRLRDWIAARGLATTNEPPIYAYYNDPFTPGFLRRNEVLIEVRP